MVRSVAQSHTASDSNGTQVINLKAARRRAPEETQSRWGMGVEGPERGFGKEVLEGREHLGHLGQASHLDFTDPGQDS